MIKSVTVTNYLGESLKMELTNPYDSGIAITDITGIGPGKADINVTELTSSDGSLYNSARLGTRNIVMTLRFMIAPDIETVRQKSYKYFPIKKELILTFETDNRSCYIAGYVESNEPVIFDENEYTQISIICPDPCSAIDYGKRSAVYSLVLNNCVNSFFGCHRFHGQFLP